jgi:hypothetical protein
MSQSQFVPLTGGQCQVPPNLSGEVYMMVTRSQSIADSEILAGYVIHNESLGVHELIIIQTICHLDDISHARSHLSFRHSIQALDREAALCWRQELGKEKGTAVR